MAEPRRRLRAVPTSSTPPVYDELEARIRSLEAERLRPVPPPPPIVRPVPLLDAEEELERARIRYENDAEAASERLILLRLCMGDEALDAWYGGSKWD